MTKGKKGMNVQTEVYKNTSEEDDNTKQYKMIISLENVFLWRPPR